MGGMCGIVSLDHTPIDPTLLTGMIEVMRYRGVDGVFSHFTPTTAFAHFAHHTTPTAYKTPQPLVDTASGLILMIDGRLSDREALISRLRPTEGWSDPSPSDADLILRAYLKWGRDCPQHLVGDYAFILWDARAGEMLCVRAPFGIRALHYCHKRHFFAFATDAAPLLGLPWVSREPDLLAVLKGLTATQTEDDDTGFFKDIHWLPRGHTLHLSKKGSHHAAFWAPELSPPIRYREADQYGEHLRHLLTTIIAEGVQSAQPTMGIMISGGMDSTTIAALAKPALEANGHKLIAYNYFKQAPPTYDERPLVRLLMAEMSLETRFIEIEPYFLSLAQLAELTFAEMPSTTIMRLPTEGIEHLRSSGGKVMLAGYGGDYFFAGPALPPYLYQLLRGDLGVLGRFLRASGRRPESLPKQFLGAFVKPLLEVGLRGRKAHATLPMWIRSGSSLYSAFETHWQGRWKASRQFSPIHSLYNAVWQRSGMRDSLLLIERLYADQRLELRLPLMDQRLARFVLGIPPDQLYSFGERKAVLRRAVKGLVPEVIRTHKKVPAPDYFQPWAQRMSRQCLPLFSPSRLDQMGVVDDASVRDALNHYAEAAEPGGYFYLHWLCSAELWLRKWVKGELLVNLPGMSSRLLDTNGDVL